ncbi:MAG: EamA family transporter [Dethiobacteria bacterium]
MGGILALAGAFLYGASHVFIRQGLIDARVDKTVGFYLTLLINVIFNSLVLLVTLLFWDSVPGFNQIGFWFFVVAGFLTSYLGRVALFESIERIGASRATALKITAPLFTVILGIIFLKERLSLISFIGIALIFIGVYFVSRETRTKVDDGQFQKLSLIRTAQPKKEENEESVKERYFQSAEQVLKWGLVFGVLSGLAFGVGNVFRKFGVLYYPFPLAGVTISSWTAFLVISAQFICQNRDLKTLLSFDNIFKGGYLWAGITSSLAQYSIFFALLFSPVSLVNSIKAGESLFTVLVSWVLLKDQELLNLRFILSALVLLSGVTLVIVYS